MKKSHFILIAFFLMATITFLYTSYEAPGNDVIANAEIEAIESSLPMVPDAKVEDDQALVLVETSSEHIESRLHFDQSDLIWSVEPQVLGNRKAYEQQYEEKRANRMAGIAKSEAPEEWAKMERERRTPSDMSAPSYTANYMAKELGKAYASTKLSRSALDAIFEPQGPSNVGGRTRGVLVDPRDGSGNTWIVGSASGGVWKTLDGGNSWQHLTPSLPNLGTNTLAFSEVNPDIIYLGTGEHFTEFIDGAGMFKTTDGGNTWVQIASPEEFPDFRNVSRIVVDPNDPDIVLTSTSSSGWSIDGERDFAIYKSSDGGESWRRTFSNSQAAVDDLDYASGSFNTLYAALNGVGVAKSTDAGETWRVIPIEVNRDMEAEDVGRIELAVSPIDSSMLWASIEPGYLLYSQDEGESWTQTRTTDNSGSDFLFLPNQGWYDNIITPHPFDKYSAYVGGIDAFLFTVDPDQMDTIETRELDFLPEDIFDDYMEDVRIVDVLPGIVDFEIRFGVGSQLAYRFADPDSSGIVRYVDFIEVPLQVWNIETNEQLALVFWDCNNDSTFTITNPESEDFDSSFLCDPEQLTLTNFPYSEELNTLLTTPETFGTLPFSVMTIKGATEDAELDLDSIPSLVIRYEFTANGRLTRTETTFISDAYDQYTGVNNFGFDNVLLGKGNHPDQHNIIAQVTDSASQEFRLIFANDGGLYVTDPDTNPGVRDGSFTSLANGYVTTQFYGADKAPGTDRFIGGTQDNGTWFMSEEQGSNADNEYVAGISGDGFEALWNQRNPDWIIGGSQGNNFNYTKDGGRTWQFPSTLEMPSVPPFATRIASHVSNPEKLYSLLRGGVWISSDFGDTWEYTEVTSEQWGFANFGDIEVALADRDVIWACSFHDQERVIHVSSDGGQSFVPTSPYEEVNLGFVSGMGTDPYNADIAYALFSFQGLPKVLKTVDRGQSWIDISGFDGGADVSSRGFPDVATNCLFVFPNNTDRIWVGTEIGIVESLDNGESWQLLTDGMGATNVTNLILRDDKIVIATHGSGIWTASVDGLEAEDIVFVPLVRAIREDLGEDTYRADILFSNAFDSSLVYLNDSLVDVLYDHDSMGYEYGFDASLVSFGANEVYAISYLGGEEYRSLNHQFELTTFFEPVRTYASAFESEDRDNEFVLDGLSIGMFSVLDGRALESNHPYAPLNDFVAILAYPIIVEDQVISYKDIAIVEPGREGTEFGDSEYWDYVAVEASTDGVDWVQLSAYDARYDSVWLEAYEQGLTPDESMFREHEIVLEEFFERDEIVLIRFRLFSDPGAIGWGWIVDDLRIAPADSMTVSTRDQLEVENYAVYPNPVRGELIIEIEGEDIHQLTLYDLNGRLIRRIDPKGSTEQIQIQTGDLTSGTYLVRVISASGGVGTKKIIVQ